MSDLMLHGVLNMPPICWAGDPTDEAQRHGRYKQASKRIYELVGALQLAKEVMIASDLILPHTMEVIDKALKDAT